MRVKDLTDNYRVLKRGELYHLYDPEAGSGSRNVYKYLCSIKKEGPTKFKIKGGRKSTTKFEELQDMIDRRLKSYKYNSEYYDPNYRKGIFEEFVIMDYLGTIGFKRDGYTNGDFYVLDTKNAYGFKTVDVQISFDGLECFNEVYKTGKTPKEVRMSLWRHDGGWYSSKCKRNVKDIIEMIDSMIKPLFISDSANLMVHAEKMETVEDVDVLMKKVSGLNIDSMNIKSYLKEQLLEMANKL
jgi:hypothetical protein